MKKIAFALVAAAGSALCGCQQDQLPGPLAGSVTIHAVLDSGDEPQTRTCVDMSTVNNPDFTGILWTPEDSIGVFSDAQANALFRNASGYAAKADFNGELAGTPRFAYYPYLPANAGRAATDLLGEVGAVQRFSAADGRLTDDYKVGTPEEGSTSRFTFKHIFSLIKFDIDASGSAVENEQLEYVAFTVTGSDGTPRSIAGQFHFDITSATPSYSQLSQTSPTVRMEWKEPVQLGSGNRFHGFATAIPEIRKGDKMKIAVATDNRLVTFEVSSAVDFQPGHVYTFPMELKLYENTKYNYKSAARAKINSFSFTAAANPGKILDKKLICSGTKYSFNKVTQEDCTIGSNEVSAMIPYLYDYKLKPTFTLPAGAKLTCGGVEIKSGETELDFSQHNLALTVETADDSHTYKVNITNTGLPVVVIKQSESGDFSIETKTIAFRGTFTRNEFVDFLIRKKDSEWVTDDEITVYNPDGSVDVATVTGGVRQRGNSTRKYPKKALGIKLTAKTPMLGMPKSKRWVLLANWIDHSVIRNAAAFRLANLIKERVASGGLEAGIPWQPSGRNVELVINGRHVGNYLLAEQVKIEKTRLNINDSFEDRLADGKSTAMADCGYLFEFDYSYDETYKFVTSKRNLPIQIKDDNIGNSTEGSAIWTALQTKINGIETNLVNQQYSAAYNDLDIWSVIDQWFIWELTQNREYTEPRSVYYFINGNGKLTAGPVWDFDRGTFHNPDNAKKYGNEANRIKPYNVWVSDLSTGNDEKIGNTGKKAMSGVWYPLLKEDDTFKQAVKTRWAALKPALEALPAEIYRLGEENRISWEGNNRMWPTTSSVRKAGNDGYDFDDWSGDEFMATYDEVLQNMVECYLNRLAGMEKMINEL